MYHLRDALQDIDSCQLIILRQFPLVAAKEHPRKQNDNNPLHLIVAKQVRVIGVLRDKRIGLRRCDKVLAMADVKYLNN